ncbi:histidine kinase [candidate division KSB1 bacterium]|nr:histidine kinase [candidate division KSB1 bacterium]
MRLRIRDILLVSSLYDLYIFEEDGRLYELIREQYQNLNLSHSPELTRVSNGEEGIALAKEERRFDLIITTMHIEDMRVSTFARRAREEKINIPIVLLAFDNRELLDLITHGATFDFDQVFIWQGDSRLLLAIIKHLEDKMNADHDTNLVGVQSIIVIEDNVRYYSYFLPLIYREVMKQSQRLISEGINLSHKQLRQRARPKIILCTNYEEAWEYFCKYHDTILGIISDIDFPRGGKADTQAGLFFAENVRKNNTETPILLHSTWPENREKASLLGAEFVLKDAPNLLDELRRFMVEQLSFGDMVFRSHNGTEVGRAKDLISLENALKIVPEESIVYHAERNHFSNWLKARTEFWLAHQLRPRKITDYDTIEETRQDLIRSLRDYRKLRQRGIITHFDKDFFDPLSSIAGIGGGSLGGKTRGLSFVNILITNYNVHNQFEGVQIYIPPAVVIGTDIFDEFLEKNDLLKFALQSDDDTKIMQRFIQAKYFPEEILGELASFVTLIQSPLAIRSSSLLEDSHNQPFAGVYNTYMLPNSDPDGLIRLRELLIAIKSVYASTFLKSAKDYIKATSFHLEDEKMAVIVQKMVGSFYNDKFYPNISGVARSYNYYPIKPQTAADGIVSAALGLGKMVVEGGAAARFCPKYPDRLNLFDNTKTTLQNAQTSFFALSMTKQDGKSDRIKDPFIQKYPLSVAEQDGTLSVLGSTYSRENETIYDGISRSGFRLVTLAPLLKSKIFPLAQILELLLDMGSWSMGTPVEIEFAVNLDVKNGPKEFGILQMRPMVLNRELEVLDIETFENNDLICKSQQVMGNGVLRNIYDIVVIDRKKFQRSKSQLTATEISYFNSKLLDQQRPFLLIGVGRWGSMDPWLGIPVTWDQIAGARAIIETDFLDMSVMPSQGSHFFQNLNSFMVGYYTVHSSDRNSFIDWEWLLAQKPAETTEFVRHLAFDKPIVIKMSGHESKGIILKPETDFGEP